MTKRIVLLISAMLLTALLAAPVEASQKYTSSTGKACNYCHNSDLSLNSAGKAFKANGNKLTITPAKTGTAKTTPTKTTAKATPSKTATKPAAKPEVKPVEAKPAVKPVEAKSVPSYIEVITKQWAGTKHNGVLEYGAKKEDWPSNRSGSYNCAKCHAGEGFKAYVADVKAAGGFNASFTSGTFKDASITLKPYGPYPDSKAVAGCDTCHDNRQLRISGLVGLQNSSAAGKPGYDQPLMMVNAGTAAACFICHDYRKTPSFPASLEDPTKVRISGPHVSSQTQMLLGFGGAEAAGEIYESSPHAAIPNSCVTCHMAKSSDKEVGGHSFAVAVRDSNGKGLKSNLNACTSCHAGLNTINRLALGDYDGDKAIEGTQDEVAGLIKKLEELVNTKLGYPDAVVKSSGGQYVIFADKAHTDGSHPTTKSLSHVWKDGAWAVDVKGVFWTRPDAKKIFNAIYNIELVKGDGSGGIHNPDYTIQLLQKSYKDLSGSDIPGARIR
ncbi:MAG: hypothetical protein M0Z31_06960 [Clostridia bacterium]|nr:hypothetical protein [Clostridia bacterium]